ncbi:glycoside hydrolase family 3 N-terminal domain-containing protein [Desulfogranum mediterraneum]|uniref:glycoside hydrolase family 3 N-terminal domain-containing protein n=1 Tax=Desulfogranum mediterraneum TaxID=160661 RepID=UPI000406D91B|nr:glycoside hydrolase family 3 N-terminal domain-containing protein [Desulfogranum mediterraneum]
MNIGQMFLVGFQEDRLEEDSWLVEDICEHDLGGVILFDRNISGRVQNFDSPHSLGRLVEQLRGYGSSPLLIGVDQEGGRVCRLKERDGFPATVSAAAMAAGGAAYAGTQAARLAAMLREHGVNLNFAPVVDLELNPDNPIIARYQRSFGADPATVVRLAETFIREHHLQGIACCLKHFPGHGSAGGDSHAGFVDISDCWEEKELAPYAALLGQGYADGVMSAHLVHRGLDPKGLPATLSREMVAGMLRGQLGFSGVVFSDDLQMGAITRGWSYKEAVQLAVLAGVDILVVGNNLEYRPDCVRQGIRAITELLDSGRIEEQQLERSLERIRILKEKIKGERPWKSVRQATA